MDVYQKWVCEKAQQLKAWPLSSMDQGWLCPGIITYQLCVWGQVTWACWAYLKLLSFPIFICSGTQWMGRYTWLSMQNPLSSCFLANTWTNSLRFGPSLHAEQSGPLRSFRRKILLRLNTIHCDRIVIWNNRFLLLFPPFWIQSNLSSCSWRHLKTYK